MTHLIFLFISFLGLLCRNGRPAENAGLSNTAWQPICGISTELGEVPAGAKHEAQAMLAYVNKLQLAAARASVYISKHKYSKQTAQALILMAYYITKASKAMNHYETTALQSHLAATSAASYLKGRLDDFMAVLEGVKGTNNRCLLKAKSEAAGPARDNNNLDGTPCSLKPPSMDARPYTSSKITKDGYQQLLHGSDNSAQQIQGNVGTAKCRVLKYHHSSNGWADTAPQGTPTAMAGYLKLDTADSNVNFEEAATLKGSSGGATTAWQTAHRTITALERAAGDKYRNATNKPSERTELTALTEATKDPSSKNTAAANTELAKLFGDDTAEKLQEAEHAISREKIPATTAGLDGEKMLGEIEDIAQLEKLQYYYDNELHKTMQSLKKQLEEAQKPKQQSPEQKEKECNEAGDEKTACDNLKEKGCVFNQAGEANKKCKFNATKATKNGVSVTQPQTVGGTETTTEKCKGKPQGECKSPDCKWEGETCKDSSIIVNKQFALTVVSAAFMALLF
uniref:Variant surface glycoprotein 1125.194 n=1 Tax=Trypanosoma brucei TaxID=5691 RepID=A0A1J0R5D2_9TRYP|nr:variant surface glycoprotein 1125.194 [Trypanosoma brucei]